MSKVNKKALGLIGAMVIGASVLSGCNLLGGDDAKKDPKGEKKAEKETKKSIKSPFKFEEGELVSKGKVGEVVSDNNVRLGSIVDYNKKEKAYKGLNEGSKDKIEGIGIQIYLTKDIKDADRISKLDKEIGKYRLTGKDADAIYEEAYKYVQDGYKKGESLPSELSTYGEESLKFHAKLVKAKEFYAYDAKDYSKYAILDLIDTRINDMNKEALGVVDEEAEGSGASTVSSVTEEKEDEIKEVDTSGMSEEDAKKALAGAEKAKESKEKEEADKKVAEEKEKIIPYINGFLVSGYDIGVDETTIVEGKVSESSNLQINGIESDKESKTEKGKESPSK